MTKGRKKTPSKIVELRGGADHTHRPPPKNEPKPPARMPRCPAHLDATAKKEWKRAGKVLMAVGLLTELDMMVLAAYCDAYSRWIFAALEIQKTSMVYKQKDGTPGLNPYLRIHKEAYEQMLKAGVLLGLSPSSRAGLKVEQPKGKSKVEAFMDRKNGAQNNN